MKKLFFAILTAATIFTACEKEDFEKDFSQEISTETAQLRLATSGYEMEEISPLIKAEGEDYYVSGIVAYKKDGVLLAKVDYGDGTKDDIAKVVKDGEEVDVKMQKDDKDSSYEKVIEEAIVKSDDCGYIVSGIIKYYEKGDWTATVDFGDGTCDDLAIKYTPEGEEITFVISEWY